MFGVLRKKGRQMNDTLATRVMDCLTALERHKTDILRAITLTGDSMSYDDIVARVLTGDLTVYDLGDAIAVMELVELPNALTFHCFLGCGNLHTLMAEVPKMEMRAREVGCTDITFSGRLGWKQMFEREGFNVRHITMGKKLVEVPSNGRG